MDCVNHSGINATAYCQSCGKALCAGCVRNAAGGQVLCEPCLLAWQSYQQPFIPPPAGGPNPSSAAVLGLIPGFKGNGIFDTIVKALTILSNKQLPSPEVQ